GHYRCARLYIPYVRQSTDGGRRAGAPRRGGGAGTGRFRAAAGRQRPGGDRGGLAGRADPPRQGAGRSGGPGARRRDPGGGGGRALPVVGRAAARGRYRRRVRPGGPGARSAAVRAAGGAAAGPSGRAAGSRLAERDLSGGAALTAHRKLFNILLNTSRRSRWTKPRRSMSSSAPGG